MKLTQKPLTARLGILGCSTLAAILSLSACDNARNEVSEAKLESSEQEELARMADQTGNPPLYSTADRNHTADYSASTREAYRENVNAAANQLSINLNDSDAASTGMSSRMSSDAEQVRSEVVSEDFDRASRYNAERSTAAGSNVRYNNEYAREQTGTDSTIETLGGEAADPQASSSSEANDAKITEDARDKESQAYRRGSEVQGASASQKIEKSESSDTSKDEAPYNEALTKNSLVNKY